MRLLTIIFALPLVAGGLNAQTNVTGSAEECLTRLDALIAQLTGLEQAASNDTARADCIAGKRHKVKGLRELTGNAAARLPSLIADEDTEGAAAENSVIAIACARADKLAAEASYCDDAPPAKPSKRRALDPPAAPVKSLRSPGSCIKQTQFAGLLVQVMEFFTDPQMPARSPTEELARFAIEPLNGWKPDECVTLDDFCVTVARALNLKVENPNDPVSCCQALRQEALPVDIYLPQRVEGVEPPALLESEVRGFFAKGYATPLPSSRRLVPE